MGRANAIVMRAGPTAADVRNMDEGGQDLTLSDPALLANRYGALNLDRPHNVKIDDFYRFDLKQACVASRARHLSAGGIRVLRLCLVTDVRRICKTLTRDRSVEIARAAVLEELLEGVGRSGRGVGASSDLCDELTVVEEALALDVPQAGRES